MVNLAALYENPAEKATHESWVANFADAIRQSDNGVYVNFVGNEGEYPNTGVLLVRGESSSARLVAVDATNVRIEIDNNGDGTTDEIIELTWAELEAS